MITEVARPPAFSVLFANAVPHDKQSQGVGGTGIQTWLVCSADAIGTNVLLQRALSRQLLLIGFNVRNGKISTLPFYKFTKFLLRLTQFLGGGALQISPTILRSM